MLPRKTAQEGGMVSGLRGGFSVVEGSTLCVYPVLMSPKFQKEFILQTDASDGGVGTVLSQLNDQGDDKPVERPGR